MKKLPKNLLHFTSLTLGLLMVLPQSFAFAASIPDNPAVDATKDWNITFNSDLNFNTVNTNNITVTDNSGSPANISVIKNGSNSVTVKAPSSGYSAGKTYTLNVSTNIQSANNKNLSKSIAMHFSIKSPTQNYSYGIIKQIDDSNIVVDIGAADPKAITYTDDWQKYVETSIVMLDGNDKPANYDDSNLKQDNIFDYKNSIIKFSNLSGKYTLASDALIVLVSKDGKYIGKGSTSDVSTAADNESFVSALLAPGTTTIKALTIEQ